MAKFAMKLKRYNTNTKAGTFFFVVKTKTRTGGKLFISEKSPFSANPSLIVQGFSF